MAAWNDFSAWRGFRKPRVATRPARRPPKHPELNMFYGYPAELCDECCSVALSSTYDREERAPQSLRALHEIRSFPPRPKHLDARVAGISHHAQHDRRSGRQRNFPRPAAEQIRNGGTFARQFGRSVAPGEVNLTSKPLAPPISSN